MAKKVDPSKGVENIIIENLHISCHSTNVSNFLTKDIGGFVIYSSGELNGVSYTPGYVYIETKEELEKIGVKSTKGQIHG